MIYHVPGYAPEKVTQRPFLPAAYANLRNLPLHGCLDTLQYIHVDLLNMLLIAALIEFYPFISQASQVACLCTRNVIDDFVQLTATTPWAFTQLLSFRLSGNRIKSAPCSPKNLCKPLHLTIGEWRSIARNEHVWHAKIR